jgi:prepilin-type N-terminal cleavage/methylation domain-containing protein
MIRREKGFTLLELLIVIALMGLVLAATSEMFIGMLRGYKQQSKMAESNIEGIIGLEMLRRDIESAGNGLPWTIPNGVIPAGIPAITYGEATNATALAFNDAPANAPRAIVSGDDMPVGAGIVAGSDYLVIKSVSVARNDACARWNILPATGGIISRSPPSEDLQNNDRVIIISPGSPDIPTAQRLLVAPSGANIGTQVQFSGAAALASPDENRIIYGVDPDTALLMPFNRADYFINTATAPLVAGIQVPGRCAPGTGVLVKAIVQQADGAFSNLNTFPLLDCVADMQVEWFGFPNCNNPNGPPPIGINNAGVMPLGPGICAGGTQAADIRAQLREVRVYILAHEGQRDTNYTFTTNPIHIGDAGLGRDFDFVAAGITNWQNYRWKIYTLVARPNNLR